MTPEFKECLDKLITDPTKVVLGEVIETIIGTMFVLDEKDLIFKNIQAENEDLYNSSFNTIINTLIYNLLFLAGYTDDEIIEIAHAMGADAKKIDNSYDA